MQAYFVTRKKMEEYYKEHDTICVYVYFFSLIKASQYIEYFGWNFWLLLFLFLEHDLHDKVYLRKNKNKHYSTLFCQLKRNYTLAAVLYINQK